MEGDVENKDKRYADLHPSGPSPDLGPDQDQGAPGADHRNGNGRGRAGKIRGRSKLRLAVAAGALIIAAVLITGPVLGILNGLNGTSSSIPVLVHLGPSDKEEVNEASVTLSWSPYGPAESYSLLITSFDQYGFRLNRSSPTSSYVLHEVLLDGTYRWTVRAVVNGSYGPVSEATTFTLRTGLSAPELSSPADGSAVANSLPVLEWEEVAHAEEYRLQVSITPAFTSTLEDLVLSGLSYAPVFSPSDGTTYYWRVSAHHEPLLSAWSETWAFSYNVMVLPPSLIGPIASTTVLGSEVLLDWEAVPGADGYQVQVATSDLFENTTLDTSTNDSSFALVQPLVESSTYSWRVRASDDGKWSPWSGTGRFFLGVEVFNVSYEWLYDGQVWSMASTVNGSDYYPLHEQDRTYNYTSYVVYDDATVAAIAEELMTTALLNGHDPAQFILSFVQGIPYTNDETTAGQVEYPRYPLETLVDGGGDCEDKAALLASLIRSLPLENDVIMLKYTSPGLSGHMAVGISGTGYEGRAYMYNGSVYYYCETTAMGWGIGQFPQELEGYDVLTLPC
ncbi:MAG: Fibronectin type III domain protein [Methanomassiliicoccales archaeon PtaB.Bin134]|nr:MAG: Fibronectin type III domain protein [Methanomassiliicoccales archaeon PtaB.Bin134]